METYLLDLTTLLQILTRQKQSGVLQAEEVRLPASRQTAQAHLVLVQGKVQSCTLFRKTGTSIIAEGSRALEMLYELGALEWRWTAEPPQRILAEEQWPEPSVGGLPSSSEEPLLPRRTVYAGTADLHLLPRNYRRVLALVDGKRPVDKIISMLGFTDQQELLRILSELQAWGLIVWG